MTPIEIHITVGSHAGRRLVLERPRITIGRAADNDVVLDVSYVSRRHAELRFEAGEWLLINHSPNGTRVHRRWVYDEPVLIEAPVRVSIGDQMVLACAPQWQGAVGGASELVEDAGAAANGGGGGSGGDGAGAVGRGGEGMSRRAKVWIGIGVYFVVMLGLIVFFGTLKEGEADARVAQVRELTTSEIVAKVRRDVAPQPADERRARAALDEGRELFNRRDVEIDARYRALEAYRIAWAFMPGRELPEIDRRRYRLLETELAELIAERYADAYTLLRSAQYEEALEAFRQLQRRYPAGANDPLLEHIDRHTADARRAVDRR